MFNRSVLIGRLTRDPELRYTSSGVAVAQFTLAVDRQFESNGQRETDFLNIVTWRQLAETCANYMRKGRMCAVEGRIQVRNYDNNEGKKVYITEIVADNVRFLESPNKDRNTVPSEKAASADQSLTSGTPLQDETPIDISDDELPF